MNEKNIPVTAFGVLNRLASANSDYIHCYRSILLYHWENVIVEP